MEECHAHCSARWRSTQLRLHRNNDFMSLFCTFRIKSCRGLFTSTIDCLGCQRDHNANYKANFGKKPNISFQVSVSPYYMTRMVSCCRGQLSLLFSLPNGVRVLMQASVPAAELCVQLYLKTHHVIGLMSQVTVKASPCVLSVWCPLCL